SEDNESGPRDWCIPRRKRFDSQERRGFGNDHDRDADEDVDVGRPHVTRIRYEHPRNGGTPTPLPKIMTLCVLPRLPGMISVLRLRIADSSLRIDARLPNSGGSSPSRKYVWSMNPSVCSPSASAASRRLVKSTCDVMS